ncbi:MAG: hypothetical protein IJN70_03475 [Clostridia bacterium]|nr:hypothetical protein [Clostridia bacterium]
MITSRQLLTAAEADRLTSSEKITVRISRETPDITAVFCFAVFVIIILMVNFMN